MFSGSIVALVTPFSEGKLDEKALQDLVSWQIAEGTQAIVACGSTGEGALLTKNERDRVISLVVEAADQRVPVIVGCGAPSTQEVGQMAKDAKHFGVDGLLVVTPYYVKPSQQGLYQHFLSVHNSTDLPIIAYNNPGRATVEISIDLLLQLAELPNIVALKDSTNDISRPAIMRSLLKKPFDLLCGDDPYTAAYLGQGGDGCISITANVGPALCQQLMVAWKNNDRIAFNALTQKLIPLHLSLVAETNPCPVKYAVSVLGKIKNELRLPLLAVASSTEEKIETAMKNAGIFFTPRLLERRRA